MTSNPLYEELDNRITLKSFCEYIARAKGEKITYTNGGRQARIGKKADAKSSLHVTRDRHGRLMWRDFATNEGGSVTDAIKVFDGISDTTEAARFAWAHLAGEEPPTGAATPRRPKTPPEPPTAPTFPTHWTDAQRQILDEARAGIYDGYAEIMQKRGIPYTCYPEMGESPNVPDNMGYWPKGSAPRDFPGGYTILPNSLLVWNEHFTWVKCIPLDENGTRDKANGRGIWQTTGRPGAYWVPHEIDTSKHLYLTEGETSALALIACGLQAIPCKPEGEGKARITAWAAEGVKIRYAYDNDKAGRAFTQKAQELHRAADVSTLFEDGDDPNDFVAKNEERYARIEAHAEKQECEIEAADGAGDTESEQIAPVFDTSKIDQIQAYFKAKAERERTEAARRTMKDPVVGEFIRLVDPYSMRQYAPAFCLIAWGVIMLSNYEIEADTKPRIVNLCARSSDGKDWILGTHRKSRSLFAQLKNNADLSVMTSAGGSVTGNGMEKAAYLWASDERNQGKARVVFWPEMGNAQTRGYGTQDRAGSIGNFDMVLDYERISKPQTKKDQAELKDLRDEYPYNGFEIRAFQDTNGANVAIERHRGAGEGRREFWLYMDNPIEDPACTMQNEPYFAKALTEGAFMPMECDRAFDILQKNALPFHPAPPQFGDDPQTKIRVDNDAPGRMEAYRYLTAQPLNAFLTARKGRLLNDKFSYLSGMSAGMHGRIAPIEDDFWIAAYLCECLSRSLDRIMELGQETAKPHGLRGDIIDRVESAGATGVFRSRLRKLADDRTLDELCGRIQGADGDFYDIDAPLVILYNEKRQAKYYARQYVKEAVKNGMKPPKSKA